MELSTIAIQPFPSGTRSVMEIGRLALAFILVSLACCFPAFSQEKGTSVDDSNLYYRALLASMDKWAETSGHIDDSDRDRIRSDYRHMIVEKNHDITEGLPSTLGENHVEYLDAQGLIERYSKLRKKFPILVIHPVKNDGARLQISITIHWISIKKRSLRYELSDWSVIKFHYDCERHTYVIEEMKLGGI
jgi:hypothetical protein